MRSIELQRQEPAAFTLIEILVATGIFMLLMALLFTVVSQASQIWRQAENLHLRQQGARMVLGRLVKDLEGIVFPLIPTNPDGSPNTDSFQFVVNPNGLEVMEIHNPNSAFWQTTLGGETSNGDIGEIGYFLRWTSGPDGIKSELCHIQIPPTAAHSIFNDPDAETWLSATKLRDKIDEYAPSSAAKAPPKGILAENVIGLWITPLSGTDELAIPYDSRAPGSSPDSVRVTIALMDPNLFKRLTNASEIRNHYSAAPETFVANLPDHFRAGVRLFTTTVKLEASP